MQHSLTTKAKTFLAREWLAVLAVFGFVLSALYTGRVPAISAQEKEVVFVLFTLFVVVEGLRQSGLIARVAYQIDKGARVCLKLVVLAFFLSMLVTNDVALLVVVPLTLSLDSLSGGKKGALVILEALAVNAGSALSPFGNPQNLFIYWHYGVAPLEFLAEIAPFSLMWLALLGAAAAFLKTGQPCEAGGAPSVERIAWAYLALFGVVVLVVLRALPVAAGWLVVAFALLFDRRALRVDYALLLVFVCFFGIAANLQTVLAVELDHFASHVFLLSAITSQVISNVPATLLLAKFTHNWRALLWGANVGGFGSLVGSLANLIAYRIYAQHAGRQASLGFALKFMAAGYGAFFLSVGLYLVVR